MTRSILLSCLLMGAFVSPYAQAADKKPVQAEAPNIDTNKDGKISLSEADALAQKQFGLYDADKNGAMSPEEYRKPLDTLAKMKKYDAAKKASEEKLIQSSFTRMDNDGDGAISKAEFLSDAELRHKTMDLNRDGSVTPQEVTDLQKKIAEAHKKAKAKQ